MICILLAAYNGETYLGEQLDSLLQQTCQDFVVYIRDDCSADGTFAIAQAYAARYPGKIFASRNEINTGSCGGNFLQMLYRRRGDYPYFMFCDQDDVWLPDKIANTMAAMEAAEARCGQKTPLLLFTDLRLVDSKLNTLEPSVWSATGAGRESTVLCHALLKCPCHGCTTLFNQALAALVQTPADWKMHDWWVYLTAVLFGEAIRLHEPTILYRQHQSNVLGTKRTRSVGFVLKRMGQGKEIRKDLQFTYAQAQALLEIYGHSLSESEIAFLSDYAALPGKGKLGRISTLLRLRALKPSLPARIAQLLYC